MEWDKGVCAGWIGWMEENIFNQPTNGGLGKFQSVIDPPIYKSGASVENFNGFNMADWVGWQMQLTKWKKNIN